MLSEQQVLNAARDAGGLLRTSRVLAPLQLLLTADSLLTAGAAEASGWVDLANVEHLRIGRSSTGGVYVFEIDWSTDGAVADFTETVAVANNGTTEKPVAARFARFRVRNTDAVAAFTSHRTTVHGR